MPIHKNKLTHDAEIFEWGPSQIDYYLKSQLPQKGK